jgi:hypothetical protein
MADKTKTETARALNAAGTQRIAKVWITGDAELAVGGGELARSIAKEACSVMERTSQPIAADAEAVVKLVGDKRKWSKESRKVRVSQCMAILSARAKLSPAIDKVIDKFGACHFLDAYYAASAITKGKDPLRAVTEKRKSRSNDGPADAGAAKKKAAALLKRARDLKHLPREWKAAIKAVCEELDVRG